MIPYLDLNFRHRPGSVEYVFVDASDSEGGLVPPGAWLNQGGDQWVLRIQGFSRAVRDVLDERQRQNLLGYTSEHDDQFDPAAMALFGWSNYLMAFIDQAREVKTYERSDLVKGIAVLLAALERLDRSQTAQDPQQTPGGPESGAESLEEPEFDPGPYVGDPGTEEPEEWEPADAEF